MDDVRKNAQERAARLSSLPVGSSFESERQKQKAELVRQIDELKSLEPPVTVFFEQENLDTVLQTSGIILFVLAMVAEEESHTKIA